MILKCLFVLIFPRMCLGLIAPNRGSTGGDGRVADVGEDLLVERGGQDLLGLGKDVPGKVLQEVPHDCPLPVGVLREGSPDLGDMVAKRSIRVEGGWPIQSRWCLWCRPWSWIPIASETGGFFF